MATNNDKDVIERALLQFIEEKEIPRDSIWFDLEMEKSLFDSILSGDQKTSIEQFKQICKHIGISFSSLLFRASDLVYDNDTLKNCLRKLAEIDQMMDDYLNSDEDDGDDDPTPPLPDILKTCLAY